MAIYTAVGTAGVFTVSSAASGAGPYTIATVSTPVQGNLRILWTVDASTGTAQSVSSVSGGGVGTWKNARGSTITVTGFNPARLELWYGTVTSTASTSVSVTFAGAVTGAAVTCVDQQFHTSDLAPVWSFDGTGADTSSNTAVTAISHPSLTPAKVSGELYASFVTNVTYVAGSTAGCTYVVLSSGDGFVYDLRTTAALAPTATSSAAAEYIATAGLWYSTPSAGRQLNQAIKRPNFY